MQRPILILAARKSVPKSGTGPIVICGLIHKDHGNEARINEGISAQVPTLRWRGGSALLVS
jgi:hypothetical protein